MEQIKNSEFEDRIEKIYSFRETLFNSMINNDKDLYQIALKLKKDLLPKKIYRFRKLDYNSIQNFFHDEQWCSNPKNFNDAMDSKLEFFEPSKKYQDKEQYFNLKEILNQKELQVCCFSEDLNSDYLWAHYADGDRGFVIEYDLEMPNEFITNLFPVYYFKISIVEFNYYLVKLIENNKNLEETIHNLEETIHTILKLRSSFKSKMWEIEKEWRYINIKSKNHANIQKFPKPSAIYLGFKMKDKDREFLSHIAFSKGIKVFGSNENDL